MKLLVAGLLLACFADAASPGSTEIMLSSCAGVLDAKVDTEGIALPGTYDAGYCWGAFTVLRDSLLVVDAKTESPLLLRCMPRDVTVSQLVTVFAEYAKRHPEKYHEDYFTVAMEATITVWPCGKKKAAVPSFDQWLKSHKEQK